MTPSFDPDGCEDLVLRHLAAIVAIGERPTGSSANQRAETYTEEALCAAGCRVERLVFPCADWWPGQVTCQCGEARLFGVANPYSPSCIVEAGIVTASTDTDLAALKAAGSIVVLHGPLTAAPWMPAEFPFYTDEEARNRVRLLRAMRPAAVITVSPREDFPVPVIIDGSFDLPSCTVGAAAGDDLIAWGNRPARLAIESRTVITEGANVIARLGGDGPCIVISAHLDTKHFTPGALDNATGVAVLLALAARFAADPPCPLELVLFNGEEHYAAPGEVAYLEDGRLDAERVRLAINLDGIGQVGYPASLAFFVCPSTLELAVREVIAGVPEVVEVDPWPAGDHMIFCLRGVPSMAVSSAAPPDALEAVIHTPVDTLDQVDTVFVVRIVDAVEVLVRSAARALGLSA